MLSSTVITAGAGDSSVVMVDSSHYKLFNAGFDVQGYAVDLAIVVLVREEIL
jgi:hypothetical protein